MKTVKSVVETRWSAKHDAVAAVKCHCDKVYDALEKLTEPTENSDTRADAGKVLSSISTFSFISFLNLWGDVLPEVDKVQQYLQTTGIGIDQSLLSLLGVGE